MDCLLFCISKKEKEIVYFFAYQKGKKGLSTFLLFSFLRNKNKTY